MLLTPSETAADRLIVALDVPGASEAFALMDDLGDDVAFYKVGLELFVAAGADVVRELRSRGKRVFLDLKIDDISETITRTVAEIARQGVQLTTIQGSPATVRAAVRGREGSTAPRLLFVTLLSSLNADDLTAMRLMGAGAPFATVSEDVAWRGRSAIAAGADGLIASGSAIGELRAVVGPGPLIVSPGIRPGGSSDNDHKRSATPGSAIAAGADYLVVGRPVRDAAGGDRRGVVRRLIDEIAAA
jgi:orotidine-5'-phosphate decarboxylase